MDLLIVESPNKAKTLSKYLSNMEVIATVGHFRDLPQKEMGVEAPEFRPQYVVDPKKKNVLSRIKAAASKANNIYIGTDVDREGEAIAWHVECLLTKEQKAKAHRVKYREVTKDLVMTAIANPTKIDYPRVAAQEARRVIDRLVGYMISPAVSKKLSLFGLSAGRVQSVLLKIIIEREEHIKQFKPIEHYGVSVTLLHGGVEFAALWDFSDRLSDGKKIFTDRSVAESVVNRTIGESLTVSEVVIKPKTVKPPLPLITSSLLQACSTKFKMSAKASMASAQRLFERGLITYHRTDLPIIDKDFAQLIAIYATTKDLPLPSSPRTYKGKAGAQEAHEGIRVTNIQLLDPPELEEVDQKVYSLIWYHTIASQLADGEDTQTKIIFKSPHEDVFISTGVVVNKPGWRELIERKEFRLDHLKPKSSKPDDENGLASLPAIQTGVNCPVQAAELLIKKTKPDSRFTVATVIAEMERRGIGRPSTYSSLIEILQFRKYVELVKGKFSPTDKGMLVYHILNPYFEFMDISYTACIEQKLDLIAERKLNYRDLVTEVFDALNDEIQNFNAGSLDLVPDTFRVEMDSIVKKLASEASSKPRSGGKTNNKAEAGKPVKADDACPKKCGGKVVYRTISTGKNKGKAMYGCSNFGSNPKCDFFRWAG